MKFSTETELLAERLSVIQGVTERRTTMPILSHTLIEGSGSSLYVTATDLDTTVRTGCEAKVEVEGSIALPARKLFEIVKELPSGKVEMEEANNHWVHIRAGTASFRIAGLPPDDFPASGQIGGDGVERASVDVPELEGMIAKTIYAVTPDELRRNISGILFEFTGSALRLVATDGHRLSLVESPSVVSTSFESAYLVPKKGVSELRRLLRQADEARIGFSSKELVAEVDGVLLGVRLIDAKFPNYRQVIPSETAREFRAGREEFLAALRRVSLLSSEKTRSVKFHLSPSRLVLTSVSPEVGEAREELAVRYDGDEIEIGFNSTYLTDVLGAMEEDEVRFGLTDPQSPAVLRPVGNDLHLAVVMPMRV